MSEALPSLPQDLIDEILVRLPVESIGRFRCVSKQWNSDLSTPQFAKAHLKYPNTENLLCFDSIYLYKLTIGSEDGVFRKRIGPSLDGEIATIYSVGGLCHGLVLLWADPYGGQSGVFLMNPITLEYERVHDGWNYKFQAYGLGYDEFKDDYKIVSLVAGKNRRFIYGEDGLVNVDIYSFKAKTWRRTSIQNCLDREFHFGPGYGIDSYAGLFVSGCLHWAASYGKRGKILSFNLGRGEFQVVEPPCAIALRFESMDWVMEVFRGCLAIICSKKRVIDVCVMKEYGVRDSWTKLTFKCPNKYNIYDAVLLLNEYELVLERYGRPKFLVSDSRKGVLKNLPVVDTEEFPRSSDDPHISVIGEFRGSLTSPNNLS